MIKIRLNEIFEQKGISNKTQFADRIGLSRWGLNKILLHDTGRIDLDTIEKLCRELDITPNDLIEIKNEDGSPFAPNK
jgi:DNA-binding Xre family transcriptional regulator